MRPSGGSPSCVSIDDLGARPRSGVRDRRSSSSVPPAAGSSIPTRSPRRVRGRRLAGVPARCSVRSMRCAAGECDVAFAGGRPPGHHAVRDRAMGFCLFNNVAVGAAKLAAAGEQVAIVDWDVHHGNGTQDIFYDDPNVLYVSTHESPLYPGTGSSARPAAGAGAGTNVNLPFPAGTAGDTYRAAFDEVVVPVIERFAPDWLIISAGFDAHRDDPLAGLRLTAGDYADMARRLQPLVPARRRARRARGWLRPPGAHRSVGSDARARSSAAPTVPRPRRPARSACRRSPPPSSSGISERAAQRRRLHAVLRRARALGRVRCGRRRVRGAVPDGPRVMLQKRSAFAHEGGTWSCAGGALDEGETPLEGALREASEEIGRDPRRTTRCSASTVFAPATDWSYTTFVVEVPGEFGASINFETDAIAWDSPDEVERPPAPRRVRSCVARALRTIIEGAIDMSDQFFPYRFDRSVEADVRGAPGRRATMASPSPTDGSLRATYGRCRVDTTARQRRSHRRSPARIAGTRRSACGSASPTTASRSAPTTTVGCASSSSSRCPGSSGFTPHSALWVSVADPEGLAAAIGLSRRSAADATRVPSGCASQT